jgi:hypothetical protein
MGPGRPPFVMPPPPPASRGGGGGSRAQTSAVAKPVRSGRGQRVKRRRHCAATVSQALRSDRRDSALRERWTNSSRPRRMPRRLKPWSLLSKRRRTRSLFRLAGKACAWRLGMMLSISKAATVLQTDDSITNARSFCTEIEAAQSLQTRLLKSDNNSDIHCS